MAGELDRSNQRDKEHLEALVKQFEERKTWWNTVFKAPDPAKERAKGAVPGSVPAGVIGGVAGGVVGGVVGGTARPGAVPPPPPPPRAPRPRQGQAVVEVVASTATLDHTEVRTATNFAPAGALEFHPHEQQPMQGQPNQLVPSTSNPGPRTPPT